MRDTLTVRLPEGLAEGLREEARLSGVPKGEIVRQAIALRLRKPTAGSVMARHFGVVRGPADLSTNKVYRRAWAKKRA